MKKLLQHERLHLRLAEYFAEKFNEDIVGRKFNGFGPTGAAAQADARRKLAAFIASLEAVLDRVQRAYERESDHGRNEHNQRMWNIAWKLEFDQYWNEELFGTRILKENASLFPFCD